MSFAFGIDEVLYETEAVVARIAAALLPPVPSPAAQGRELKRLPLRRGGDPEISRPCPRCFADGGGRGWGSGEVTTRRDAILKRAWRRWTFETMKFVQRLDCSGRYRRPGPRPSPRPTRIGRGARLSLASHSDLERIERKLIEHDGEFKLIKFILGMLIGSVDALVLKSFFLTQGRDVAGAVACEEPW